MSHAYTASRGLVNNYPVGPSVFPTTIESVTVPPGDYVIYATGTYIPSNELICDIGSVAHGDWTSIVNGYRSYALVGVESLPNGGTIELDCKGGPYDQYSGVMTDNNLVAVAVDAVN